MTDELNVRVFLTAIQRAKKMEKHIAALETQLAATKARLAEYEEGYDPAVKPPKEFELVLANSKAFGWRTVQYSHEYFDEGSCGVGFGIKGCIRWFPLSGKGGEA